MHQRNMLNEANKKKMHFNQGFNASKKNLKVTNNI